MLGLDTDQIENSEFDRDELAVMQLAFNRLRYDEPQTFATERELFTLAQNVVRAYRPSEPIRDVTGTARLLLHSSR